MGDKVQRERPNFNDSNACLGGKKLIISFHLYFVIIISGKQFSMKTFKTKIWSLRYYANKESILQPVKYPVKKYDIKKFTPFLHSHFLSLILTCR